MDKVFCAKLEKALKMETCQIQARERLQARGRLQERERIQDRERLKIRGKSQDGSDGHREQVIQAVRREALKRRPRRRISFLEFLLRQIPFMAKGLWLIQGGIAAFTVLLLSRTLGGDFRLMGIRHIPLLAGMLAIFLVMTGAPFLVRSYQCRMYEVEMASRMSLAGVLLADLILAAAGSVAAFGVCGTLMARGMALIQNGSGWMIVLYFFLPFALSGSGCALILQNVRSGEEAARGLGFCEGYCVLLLAMLWYLFRTCPWIYEELWIWRRAGILMVPVLAYSIARWVKRTTSIKEGWA